MVYVAQALVTQSRVMVLTSTKGLQDQLLQDFGEIGLKDIRGKSSYRCACDPTRTCEDGMAGKCLYKGTNICPYSQARKEVLEAQLATTNYSCWIAANKYGQGFGKFDLLICDEAHNAPSELAKAMQVQLSERESTEMLKKPWPGDRERGDMDAWKHWALVAKVTCDRHVTELKKAIDKTGNPKAQVVKDYRHYRNLSRKLADVATCKPDRWVVDEWSYGYQFDPIDPAMYGERVLFCGVEKVILTSGTIRPHTLEMLGMDREQYDFFEYDLGVKPDRSPLIYVPTISVSRKSSDWELRKLVRRIDEIIGGRLDRKGIIHTSNFKLRDYIVSNSEWSKFMVSNYTQNGDITAKVISDFKKLRAPAVLISPSVTTGYDFPYDDSRYQVIAKLPFPDSRSKVDQARLRVDPDRDAYHTIQAVVQAFGRGDRAEDDWQEVIILDDNWDWFYRKYARLGPSWLGVYIRRMTKVPDPPSMEEAA